MKQCKLKGDDKFDPAQTREFLAAVAIIVVNAYVILAPLLPAGIFWVEQHATSRLSQLNLEVHNPQLSAIPSGNRLVAPAMLLDQPIFDGPTIATANKGIWHRPASSTPDRGGNTVLAGHRFTYTNPRGIFYYLDKTRHRRRGGRVLARQTICV